MLKLHRQIKQAKLQPDNDPVTGKKKTNLIGILSICIFTFALGIG